VSTKESSQDVPLADVYISKFGSPRNKDTSSWDRFHKTASTGTWDQTSKRRLEMSKEIALKYNVNNYSKALQFLANIHNDPVKIIKYLQEDEHDGSVLDEAIKNCKKYYFKINLSELKQMESIQWKRISQHEPFWNEEELYRILQQVNFWKIIKEFTGIRRRLMKNYNICILSELSDSTVTLSH